jgi:hypothetical protein
MFYAIIYYLIFLVLMTMVFWFIEDSTINKFGTKIIEVDGQSFLVPDFTALEGEPRLIKSIGSKLTCDSLEKITGQKIKINRNLEGSRNLLSGNTLKVDCLDEANNISAEYKPREFYTFEGKNNINEDVYEFYNRLAIDASKKDFLSSQQKLHIEIPYTIDKCETIDGKLKCEKYVDESIRRKRIYNYMKKKILERL